MRTSPRMPFPAAALAFVVPTPAVLARCRPALIRSIEAVALEECGERGACVGGGERVKRLERGMEFPERRTGGSTGEAGDPTDCAALAGRVLELEHQMEYLDGIGKGDDAGEVAGGGAYGAEVAEGECAFEAGADSDVRGGIVANIRSLKRRSDHAIWLAATA